MGEGTYQGVVDVLDPAPLSVRGEDLQGRDGLAVQDCDRPVVCGVVLNVGKSDVWLLLTGVTFEPDAVGLGFVFSRSRVATC